MRTTTKKLANPPGASVAEPEDALRACTDELSEARRCHASILKNLSGIFYRCELGAPWRMSFLSDGIEPLTGFSRAEMEAKDGWSAIVDPADLSALEALVSRAVSEGRGFETMYRIVRKDGAPRWVSERGHPIFDDGGNPLFLEGIISDISGRKEADELQRAAAARWRKTLDTIPQMVWTMSADGTDNFFNKRWLEFTGLSVGDKVDRLALVHPDDRDWAAERWALSFRTGDNYEAQYRLKHVSGEYRWVLGRGSLERDDGGKPLRWYGTCTDVHDRVIAQQALEASEELNRGIVSASPDCICMLDLAGRLQFMNDAALTAVGAESVDAVRGMPWEEYFPASARGPARIALRQASKGRRAHFSASQGDHDATRWWDIILAPIKAEAGKITGIITIARDMTYQKIAEERARWAANHDPLTGLPNRHLFQKLVDEALMRSADALGQCSILMMDLDDFKRTNDALGHDAGDALLTEFARRVRGAVRSDDVVARLGGDEFAVLLRDVGSTDQLSATGAAILRALEEPFTFDGRLLDIKSTIGASSFPAHGTNRVELLKHADIALYVAKASNRGGLKQFQFNMRAEVQRRISMLALAQQALLEDRIAPFYQAKFNIRTGELDGFEALLRWRHNHRVQSPGAIAAAFNDPSLASEISNRMIDSVIRDVQSWQERGVRFGHVAINAGAAELRQADFAEKLFERLERAEVPPSAIQIEVTETVFLGRGAQRIQRTLRKLAAGGIEIALDDFGTGYASLSHLNDFPVDVIKIDRSFTRNLEKSARDRAIIRGVINLGRSLGIRIVAEGVETAAQMAFLRKHRCDFAQGYLISKPQDSSRIRGLVEKWSTQSPIPQSGPQAVPKLAA